VTSETVYQRIAAATATGNVEALAAIAMELAVEVAGLASLRDAEVARKAGQAERKRRQRHAPSRDVTGQDGTARDVTDRGSSPPQGSSSFPTPHITLPSPAPLPRGEREAASGSAATSTAAATGVSRDFAAIWAALPKRHGGNSRKAAERAYRARVAQGAEPREVLAGAERYAKHVRSLAKEGTSFVMQGATFLGPDEHWTEEWPVEPPPSSEPRVPTVSRGASGGGSNGSARGDAVAEAAWASVLAMLPQWQRREITAERFAELPVGVRRGISRVGGFGAITETRPDKMHFKKLDFIAGFRDVPASTSHADDEAAA
jgi:hypothetical protein